MTVRLRNRNGPQPPNVSKSKRTKFRKPKPKKPAKKRKAIPDYDATGGEGSSQQ
jgi:hypothetical protein